MGHVLCVCLFAALRSGVQECAADLGTGDMCVPFVTIVLI